MRVTTNTFPDSLLNNLGQLTSRQNRLQNQASTGQRVVNPEDDPEAMRRVLNLQDEARSASQYQSNVATIKEYATVSYTAINSLKKICDRANEISVLADGTKAMEDLKIYRAEVSQLIQQASQIVNAKNRGDYIFAGTQTDQPPFLTTTDASGLVTSVTYQGNSSVPECEVANGTIVSVQVPGENASGAGARGLVSDPRTGADFFNHLISLQNNLVAGDVKAINQTDVVNLRKDEENLVLHIADNGAVQARLNTTTSLSKQQSLSVDKLISNEADADLAQTMVQLSQVQNAYKAALQSGGTILNQSLLDYLR